MILEGRHFTTGMPPELKKKIELEIAHVLFIDIAAYSKLAIDAQVEEG
jgi:hypothetical protein